DTVDGQLPLAVGRRGPAGGPARLACRARRVSRKPACRSGRNHHRQQRSGHEPRARERGRALVPRRAGPAESTRRRGLRLGIPGYSRPGTAPEVSATNRSSAVSVTSTPAPRQSPVIPPRRALSHAPQAVTTRGAAHNTGTKAALLASSNSAQKTIHPL